MDQQKYENVLFLMTILNIVAGLVSISLAAVAIVALRDLARERRLPTITKLAELNDSMKRYHNETPTEAGTWQPVRRSPLASLEGRRDFYS